MNCVLFLFRLYYPVARRLKNVDMTGFVRAVLSHLKLEITVFSLARLARFERATYWFVARYSIQLSYRRISYVPKYISTTQQKMQVLFLIFFWIALDFLSTTTRILTLG